MLRQCFNDVAVAEMKNETVSDWTDFWVRLVQKTTKLKTGKPLAKTPEDWRRTEEELVACMRRTATPALKTTIANKDKSVDTSDMERPELVKAAVIETLKEMRANETSLCKDWPTFNEEVLALPARCASVG